MVAKKENIIQELRKEILSLGGFKQPALALDENHPLAFLNAHFPKCTFPKAAVHEFVCTSPETIASTCGFISALVNSLFPADCAAVWISEQPYIFPPAIRSFTIEPHQLIFIQTRSAKESLWVLEEALKCKGLCIVIAEVKEINFLQSRRFQLAVESSGATGFLLNLNPKKLTTTACISRWQVSSLPSSPFAQLPGIGYPRWKVELQKIRNGTKGSWDLEWTGSRLQPHCEGKSESIEWPQKKAG